MMTLFYAAALCILGLVIAVQTGRTRFSSETFLGTGESFEMLQITRAHGNLIEYASQFGGNGNEKIIFNLYDSNEIRFIKIKNE